jgi:hypothetical protein
VCIPVATYSVSCRSRLCHHSIPAGIFGCHSGTAPYSLTLLQSGASPCLDRSARAGTWPVFPVPNFSCETKDAAALNGSPPGLIQGRQKPLLPGRVLLFFTLFFFGVYAGLRHLLPRIAPGRRTGGHRGAQSCHGGAAGQQRLGQYVVWARQARHRGTIWWLRGTAVRGVVVGSPVRRTPVEREGHARGPAMEEWYDRSLLRLRLCDIGRCSSGGRRTRRWPTASSVGWQWRRRTARLAREKKRTRPRNGLS